MLLCSSSLVGNRFFLISCRTILFCYGLTAEHNCNKVQSQARESPGLQEIGNRRLYLMHPATMHYHEPSDSYGCRPKTLRLRAELIRSRQPWSILVRLIWAFLFGLNLQQQNRAETCKKTWPLCTSQSSQQKTNLVSLAKTTIVTSRLSWGATEFRGKLAWKLMHLRFLATFGMAAKNMFDYNRTWADHLKSSS